MTTPTFSRQSRIIINLAMTMEEFAEADFSPKEIRQAIQTLRHILGDSVVDAIENNLELYGLLTNNDGRFTIVQVHTALERMFDEGATFLMRSISASLLGSRHHSSSI